MGRALRAAEPVPDHVVDGARAAWTWRTIDEELAELVFDSAVELTGVRSEDTARQLTFRAPGVEIEVMVVDDAARRIVGQLIPPGECAVQLTIGDRVHRGARPTTSAASRSSRCPRARCASRSRDPTAATSPHRVGAALRAARYRAARRASSGRSP